jgi:predicted PurR-regulated permease PerM
MELAPLVQEYGVMVALVLFFVWQSWKREQRLASRIDTIEGEYTATLKELVRRSNDVIAANTEIMEQLKKHLARIDNE